MIKSALFAAAALASACAAPAFAKSVPVSYGDLDLASQDGQKAFAHRIDKAARQACGYSTAATGTRLAPRAVLACYKEARAAATTRMATIIENNRLGG